MTDFISFGSGPVTIPFGKANPYPADIMVAGVNRPISKIQITIDSLTIPSPGDLDMLLEHNGKSLIIMSDCGGNNPVFGTDLFLDDTASQFMPQDGQLFDGANYKPTNNGGGDSFPVPAPQPPPPYLSSGPEGTATLNGTYLTVFNPNDLNGLWRLWIVNENESTGQMGSWVITFFFAPIPCLHKDTLVNTSLDNRKRISDIKAGDIVIDHKNKPVTISYNMIFPSTREFIHIPKNAIDRGVPSTAVYIRKGHPILIDGKEVVPEELRNINSQIKKVKVKEASEVYSLCTEKRTFVKMNGLDVATWQRDDWEAKASKSRAIWRKQ